jgi:hypothetical protein
MTVFLTLCDIEMSFTQTYSPVTNVKTPNNSTVQDTYTLTSTDVSYSPSQIAALAADYYANYNEAVVLEAPSFKYNCHGYAWLVTEGGNKVWIGRYDITTEDIYWTDGSYIEVPENIATKVSYHQDGNHSAIRLSSNWYQSKWGWAGALVKHHPDRVPSIYQTWKAKKYYIRKPSITGPATACPGSSVTLTISNLPAGATVNWSAPNTFSVESSSNTSVTCAVPSLPPNAGYIISASIFAGSSHVTTLTHSLNVRGGKVVVSGSDYVGYLKTETYTANIFSTCNQPVTVEWKLDGSPIETGRNIIIKSVAKPVPVKNMEGIASDTGERQTSRQVQGTTNYTEYMLVAALKNSSGTVIATSYRNIAVYGYPSIISIERSLHDNLDNVKNSSGKDINVYPNPAGDYLNISINGKSASDIRLYDAYGTLLRQAKTGSGTVQLNVSNLPNGLYYLHIYDGINKTPEVRQIMVKHD